ncbi:MAG: winged helix-turn-helix transcriptional regulator [Blastochloris sp.]|nr:winged helix-turn-helix transcriptional regulator [Blastochloris sp.]
MEEPAEGLRWTFLTNHAHVLVCLRLVPGQTLRDVAQRVGITERAVQRIVAELEMAGVLERRREGRKNEYKIREDVPLRHELESHRTVGDLLRMVTARGVNRRDGK